jgi:hypothetical protein
MSIDKQPRPPLLTDPARWRRAIFDSPQQMAFQRMDDSLAYYANSINLNDKTLVLSKRSDKNAGGKLTFQRPAQDQLILDGSLIPDGSLNLDGSMDGHQVHMELQLVDRNKFLLVRRGFHWIQEFPMNQ